MSRVPAYPADEIRRLAVEPSARRLTKSALDGCLGLGLSLDQVWETLAMAESDACRFIKTVDSDKRAGEKLDVYDAAVDGQRVYVKVKLVETGALPPRLLVVLSYKRNEYYERNMR